MTTVTCPPRMLSGETLLGACPRLRILATSREALDVSELEVDHPGLPGTDPFGADRFRGRP
ncbi:hypothetical protein ACWF9G_06750 [Nocardia sp. NPDC055029]